MNGLFPKTKSKFVPPRPIDGKAAPSNHEWHKRRTPAVAHTAAGSDSGATSAAPVKRVKQPTRQTKLAWHKPRPKVAQAHKERLHGRRSPPPAAKAGASEAASAASPSAVSTAAASSATAAPAAPATPSATTAPPPPSLHSNEHDTLSPDTPFPSTPACKLIAEVVAGDIGSTFTPDTQTAASGSGNRDAGAVIGCKAFIMAAETPTRAHQARVDHRLPRNPKTGSLRVPDTQEGAEHELEPKPKAGEQRRVRPEAAKQGRVRVPTRPKGCGDINGDGQGGRGPSDLTTITPPPLELDRNKEESKGVGVVAATLAGREKSLSSRDSYSDSSSGSLSPDLLRRYPAGATDDMSKDLARRSAVAGSCAAGQGEPGSDASDSWPDSPDLLGGYACGEGKGLSEVSARVVGAEEAEAAGRSGGGGKLQQQQQQQQQLSRSRTSEGPPHQWHATTAAGTTAIAPQESVPVDLPGREDISRTTTATATASGTAAIARRTTQGAGSTTLKPSKKRPRQETQRSVPHNPYLTANLSDRNLSNSSGARGLTSLPETQRCPPALAVKPRDGRTISTTAVDERKPPADKEEGGLFSRLDRGNRGEAIAAVALRKGDAAPGVNDGRTIRTVGRSVPTDKSSHLPGQGDGDPPRLAVAAATVAVGDRDFMDERAQQGVVASGLETASLTLSGAPTATDCGSTTSGASNAGERAAAGRSRLSLPGAVGTKPRSSALRLPAVATSATVKKTRATALKAPANPAQGLPHSGCADGDIGFTAASVAQSLPRAHAGSVDDDVAVTDCSSTPPEERFEAGRWHMYKNAGAGRGWRGRGRGRGGGRGGGRGSAAPVPAPAPLLGSWRTERGKKGEKSKRYYVTRAGQQLTGKEAYMAEKEDKRAAKKGPVVRSRSTIMRIRRSASVEPSKDGHDGEQCLDEEALMLETYGVPAQLVESYHNRGVRKLFDWQARCLRVDDGEPLAGGNLVYSAPTSGGKTLVAELLVLRALLQHNGTMVLFVVPFIALATEKRDYLRDVWAPLQLNVQAFHGSEGGDASAADGVNVAVCTMEKANSIVNRLAEEGRLEALSAVVVDEIHLIGDGQRGFLLELMLTKLRMMCPAKVQLVCLSATLPNIEVMAKWLQASLYKTEFRPVELRHRVCKGRVVYKPSGVYRGGRLGQDRLEGRLVEVVGGGIRRVGKTTTGVDPDGVVDLVKDALARDMSVLVFCATKKWCQQAAALLAKEILSDRARAKAAAAVSSTSAAAAAAAAGARVAAAAAAGARVAAAATSKAAALGASSVSSVSTSAPSAAAAAAAAASLSSSSSTPASASAPTSSPASSSAAAREAAAVARAKKRGPPITCADNDCRKRPSIATSTATSNGKPSGSGKDNHAAPKLSPPGRPSLIGRNAEGKGETVFRKITVGVSAASVVQARLRETPVGLDDELSHLVSAGVAFHHSGLVLEERAVLEDSFRQGSIRVIVATSTLAAGVNLPAHRVIIRSPQIGIGMLDSTRYHQMAGRSGRAGVSRGQEGGKAVKGVDTACGESFLIIPKNDNGTIPDASTEKDKFKISDAFKLISAPLPELKSALRGAKGGGLERALLEVVVSKTVRTRAGAAEFASKTLLAQQIKGQDVATACDKAMEFLLHHNFIVATVPEGRKEYRTERPKEIPKESRKEDQKDSPKEGPKESLKEGQKDSPKEGPKEGPKESRKEDQKDSPKEGPKEGLKESLKEDREGEKGRGEHEDYGVAPTQLGQATFFSGLSPVAAVDVHQSLDKACQNLVVSTELHALYLLTPLEGIEPHWGRFREEYTAWREDDPSRVVGMAVGIEEGVLVNASGNTGPKYGNRYYDLPRGSGRRVDLQPYRRFFGALLLKQAVEEVPIRDMVARLGIERGTLQALQKEASVFCGMVVSFCRHLQWHELANVLYSFQDRLGYSAKPELLPLVRLSRDLPPFRARALWKAGYPSPLQLAGADAEHVADVLLRCVPFRSAGWEESAERYRSAQARRLAENVIRLANAEILRQLRSQLSSAATVPGGTSPASE